MPTGNKFAGHVDVGLFWITNEACWGSLPTVFLPPPCFPTKESVVPGWQGERPFVAFPARVTRRQTMAYTTRTYSNLKTAPLLKVNLSVLAIYAFRSTILPPPPPSRFRALGISSLYVRYRITVHTMHRSTFTHSIPLLSRKSPQMQTNPQNINHKRG